MSYLLALDQGTTSSRAILFDETGAQRALAQREFEQIYPQPGWVEHDPAEIWATQMATATEALSRANVHPREVAALGITNQRETTVLWDRQTGQPIHNAIVWQDRRTAPMIDRLKAEGKAALVTQKTGLVPDAYFSASKVAWLLDHVPGARAKAEAGQLAFGTIDSWLVYQLTDRRLHLTDVSNASRTMLFNLHTLDWDDELLAWWGIPRGILPAVRGSSEVYGEASAVSLSGIPIAGIAGDQQAALFGQRCFQPGCAKNTYGTGCFLLMNTGSAPVVSRHNLLTTVAWRTSGAAATYALEGSVFIGGAVVQWLRDGLQIIRSAGDIEALAATVPDSGGLYFVPAFAGLGAPHWDAYARGTLCGITRGTTAGHLARAALESIAFQVADLIEAMSADAGLKLPELRVDGGACANNLLMQMQADLLQIPIIRPKVVETTALGAACLAGLATGIWRKTEDLAAYGQADRAFEPQRPASEIPELRANWQKAVGRAKGWLSPA